MLAEAARREGVDTTHVRGEVCSAYKLRDVVTSTVSVVYRVEDFRALSLVVSTH